MCQTNSRRKFIFKDLIAYKVYMHLDDKFYSPYQKHSPRLNEVIEAYGNKKFKHKFIDSGYFHCFAKIKDAKNFVGDHYGRHVVVEIIIPHKKNRIYVGDFDNKKNSICARKIIVTGKVLYSKYQD